MREKNNSDKRAPDNKEQQNGSNRPLQKTGRDHHQSATRLAHAVEAPKVSAPVRRSTYLQIRRLSKMELFEVPTVQYIFNAPSYRRSMAYMKWVG